MLRSSVALAPVKTGKNVTSVAHSIPFHQFQSSPDYRQTVVSPLASGITPGKPQFTLHFSLIFITSVSLPCCVMMYDDDAVLFVTSTIWVGHFSGAGPAAVALLQSSEDLMESLLSVSTPTLSAFSLCSAASIKSFNWQILSVIRREDSSRSVIVSSVLSAFCTLKAL